MQQAQAHSSAIGHVRVFAGRCLNQRNNRASCDACVPLCPTSAISLFSESVHVDARLCIGCGVCMAGCPMEVFEAQEWNEHSLVDNVRGTQEQGGAIRVVCPQALYAGGLVPQAKFTSVCYGAFSPGALAEAGYYKPLVFYVDSCAHCICREGYLQFERQVQRAEEWLSFLFGRPRLKPAFMDGAAVDAYSQRAFSLAPIDRHLVGRRDMLAGFLRRGSLLFGNGEAATAAATPLPPFAYDVLTEQHLPRWRASLERFWRQMPEMNEAETVWPALEIDPRLCVACGACRKFCPTGAMKCQTEDGELSFTYTPGLCADCGLCALACPSGCLERFYSLSAAPFEAARVATFPLQYCPRCLEPMAGTFGDACYWCSSEPDPRKLNEALRKVFLPKDIRDDPVQP